MQRDLISKPGGGGISVAIDLGNEGRAQMIEY